MRCSRARRCCISRARCRSFRRLRWKESRRRVRRKLQPRRLREKSGFGGLIVLAGREWSGARGRRVGKVRAELSVRSAERVRGEASVRFAERAESAAGRRSRLVGEGARAEPNARVLAGGVANKELEERASANASGGRFSGIVRKGVARRGATWSVVARIVSGRVLRGHGTKSGRLVRRARGAKVRGRSGTQASPREGSSVASQRLAGSHSLVRGRRETSVLLVRAERNRIAARAENGHSALGAKALARSVRFVRNPKVLAGCGRFVHVAKVRAGSIRFVHVAKVRAGSVRFGRGLRVIANAVASGLRRRFADERKARARSASGRFVRRRAESVLVRLVNGDPAASRSLAANRSLAASRSLAANRGLEASRDSAESPSLARSVGMGSQELGRRVVAARGKLQARESHRERGT